MAVFVRVFAIPLATRQLEKWPGSNPTLSAIFFNNLQALQSVCNHSLCFSVEVMTISISRSGRALTQFVDNAHSSMCRHST